MFTVEQISRLLEVVQKNNLFFISSKLGPDYLTQDEVRKLQYFGINPFHQYDKTKDIAQTMFHFGLISDALGTKEAKDITFENIKHYFESGDYIPLTKTQYSTITSIKKQFLGDIKANEGRIFQDINNIISKEEKNNRLVYEKVIRNEIEAGMLKRSTSRDIAQELGRKTGDWSRNFNRIVEYHSHQAFDEGRAAMIEDKYGNEAKVFKDVFPGACRYCISAYLTGGIGSEPIIFKLSELKANGSNIGRKVTEYKPVIGNHHPYCFDKETEVLTNEGWKFFKDLHMKESFLSLNPETEELEWNKAINKTEYFFEGMMDHFKGRWFDLMTTPNHKHAILVGNRNMLSKVIRLVSGENLSKNTTFVRNIGQWVGEDYNICIGDYKFNQKDFCQFMGWWLSEGSIVLHKTSNHYSSWQLHITQWKNANRKEIEILCKKMFKKVWVGKESFSIPVVDEKLIAYFKQFGHSFEKYIPIEVKNSNLECIELFLKAYLAGDGHLRKGNKNKNYIGNFKNTQIFSTSSIKMSSDLGELIFKTGDHPSYHITIPKPVFFKKNQTTYLAKNNQIIITRCTSKTSTLKNIEWNKVFYKDFVYDVELEKNHILFVRRNNKTTASGNCRCTLHKLDTLYDWNSKTRSFDIPKENAKEMVKKINRNPIRIKIRGKEYSV